MDWLARTVLSLVYALLIKFLPPGRHVAFVSFPDAADNALAVYKQMLSNGESNDSLVWLVANVGRATRRLETLIVHSRSPRVVKKNTVRGLWIFLRAKHVFFTHGHYPFVRRIPGRRRLINLWHGMPLKAIGLLDGKRPHEVQASDAVVASSQFFSPLMASAFGLTAGEVWITGLPRCDQLVGETSQQVLRLLERLRGNCPKVVIWMPTYRFSTVGEVRVDSHSSTRAVTASFIAGMRQLSRLGSEWGCHVIAKLHPMDFLNHEQLPTLENVTLINNRSTLLDSIDLYELLAVVDGLITDVSSVCFDFMATRRPILIAKEFIADYSRSLLFDPNELFAATFTSDGWIGAEPFFSAVASGAKVEEAMVSKFCEFSDEKSSARLLARLENPALMGHA